MDLMVAYVVFDFDQRLRSSDTTFPTSWSTVQDSAKTLQATIECCPAVKNFSLSDL